MIPTSSSSNESHSTNCNTASVSLSFTSSVPANQTSLSSTHSASLSLSLTSQTHSAKVSLCLPTNGSSTSLSLSLKNRSRLKPKSTSAAKCSSPPKSSSATTSHLPSNTNFDSSASSPPKSTTSNLPSMPTSWTSEPLPCLQTNSTITRSISPNPTSLTSPTLPYSYLEEKSTSVSTSSLFPNSSLEPLLRLMPDSTLSTSTMSASSSFPTKSTISCLRVSPSLSHSSSSSNSSHSLTTTCPSSPSISNARSSSSIFTPNSTSMHYNQEKTYHKIRVYNLAPEVSPTELAAIFSQVGTVKKATLEVSPKSSRCSGSVYFKSAKAAKRAETKFNGEMLKGNKVTVLRVPSFHSDEMKSDIIRRPESRKSLRTSRSQPSLSEAPLYSETSIVARQLEKVNVFCVTNQKPNSKGLNVHF